MYKLLRYPLVALSTLLLTSSLVASDVPSGKNDITLEEDTKVQTTKEHLRIAADNSSHVINQMTLENTISSLSTQLMQNKKIKTNRPVLITSFVRLDNLKKTTEFGRLVSESLINDLSIKGFNIIEFRGQLAVSVNAQGEYFITRNVDKLRDKIPNTYVVVGTYSRQFGKIMLNSRVIDNLTGQIISSARSTYAHGLRNDCVIFKDCQPPRTIKIIKE